ncbi:XTP/dITP diphosphohydrolase [Rhizobiales bacterium GAS188]|nr:XTP/dITP diphosphohydrolase [Rhizobiales bacterium GAS188]
MSTSSLSRRPMDLDTKDLDTKDLDAKPEHRPLRGRVVIATHNPGKLAEMRELLAPFGIEAVSAGELGLPVPAETGHMFCENAAIKAHAAAKATGLPAISDDSGVCVDALDGAPGLFSADWAVNKDFRPAMERVEYELRRRGACASERRRAHFVSALVIAWPDGHEELFEGRVHGEIVWPPRGDQGFGYDPMFQPEGHRRSFGEMPAEEKHGIDWTTEHDGALSHRARAFRKLAQACLSRI